MIDNKEGLMGVGNKLSVEASDLAQQYVPEFLLVEGSSPIRLDVVVTLRKRFHNVSIEHLYPKNSAELAHIPWRKYDLVLISCPLSIDELSWLSVIKQRNSDGPVVIVMTGSNEAGRDAIWEGADLYLQHDVSSIEFSARLDEALEVDRLFGKYPMVLPEWHLLEVLHDSENSIIFRVENRQGEQGVVKRFKFNASGLSGDILSRFMADAATLIQQSDRGLVSLSEAGVTEGAVYLVMEYIEGVTLKYMLDEYTSFDLGERLGWFTQITKALLAIHEFGLLHRDLKSSNILVRDDGSLVLLDFGVENQLLIDSGFLQENEIYCTPFYVSPERIVGDPCTEQSDLYALGIILYELLMGDKPYLGRGLSEVLQHHVFTPVPVLPENLSAYQPLLSGLLAKSPEGRIKHAGQVLSWLDDRNHQCGACAA